MARKPDRRIGGFVGNYFVEAMIGWGGSSKVYRVRHTDTLQHAAMKVISKPKSRIGDLEKAYAECSILESLEHPHIVKMYEWFQTDKKIFIFMELARDGDLLEFVNARGTVPETLLRKWFAQLVQALNYVHSKGLVHKDVKLDNILIDGDRILLADWGYAHEWQAGFVCQRYAGTQGYWAPEVMAERPFEGPETDCWSLGVTLYGMAIGRLPFNRESATYHDDVMQGRYVVPTRLPADMRTVIYGLMTVDPIARFNLNDVMETEFYRTGGYVSALQSPFSSSPLSPSLSPTISPRPPTPPVAPHAHVHAPAAAHAPAPAPAASGASVPVAVPVVSSPAAHHAPPSPVATLHVPLRPGTPDAAPAAASEQPAPRWRGKSPARPSSPDNAEAARHRTKSPAVKHSNFKLSEQVEQTASTGALERSPREPPQSEASTPNRSRANSTDEGDSRARRLSLPQAITLSELMMVSRSFTPETKPATKPPGTMQKLMALFKSSKTDSERKSKDEKEERKGREKEEKRDKRRTKDSRGVSSDRGTSSERTITLSAPKPAGSRIGGRK